MTYCAVSGAPSPNPNGAPRSSSSSNERAHSGGRVAAVPGEELRLESQEFSQQLHA